MKKFFFVSFILLIGFSIKSLKAQSFKEFNFDSDLKELQKENHGIAIYLTALWCHPCVAKTGIIADYFNQNKNIELTFVYDPDFFSPKKYNKIIGATAKGFKHFFISKEFYGQRKAIEFNSQNKMIKRVSDTLIANWKNDGTLADLWFGKLIFLNKDNEIFVLKFQKEEDISLCGIDNFIKKHL